MIIIIIVIVILIIIILITMRKISSMITHPILGTVLILITIYHTKTMCFGPQMLRAPNTPPHQGDDVLVNRSTWF